MALKPEVWKYKILSLQPDNRSILSKYYPIEKYTIALKYISKKNFLHVDSKIPKTIRFILSRHRDARKARCVIEPLHRVYIKVSCNLFS